MNARNTCYLFGCNPRRFYRQVDDKLTTKRICERHGIPVPSTYGVVQRQGDVKNLPLLLAERRQFVVKPARGSGGRGSPRGDGSPGGRTGGRRRRSMEPRRSPTSFAGDSGRPVSPGEQPDQAILEELITPHPTFETIVVGGTPDFRIVVYRGLPVMAMARLPTHICRGRANLHQGAVGVGIELACGETRGGVWQNRRVLTDPDTHCQVGGLRIPRWERLLLAAMDSRMRPNWATSAWTWCTTQTVDRCCWRPMADRVCQSRRPTNRV